ncbi:hypothetical protein [Roseobacter sp. A03A-229]
MAPLLGLIEKTCFQVAAHGLSRLRRREMAAELRRLQQLPRSRSYLEVGGFMTALFMLSIIAAGFGWITFGAFLLIAIVVFR